ncbi:MAG: DUF167 family protein [Candidatus Diapherotrites archaeon]|nr:DUF167 family protein [Candidatus Diapherotrites archaeon]
MITLRETRNGVMFKIHVSPNSKRFGIKGFDSWTDSLLVSVSEPPDKGKANAEIEKELGKVFGKKTQIVSGLHSRTKTVEVLASRNELLRVLERLA